MGRRFSLAVAIVLAIVLLPEVAHASDLNREVWDFLHQTPKRHFLYLAAGFLVFGIIAKFREASMLLVFGSFFCTALTLGAFLIFTLTGELGDPRPNRANEKIMMAEVNGVHAPPPRPVKLVKVGAACKHNGECDNGGQCAKVGGSKHCWMPCGTDRTCDTGFACMVAVGGQNVCVK